jgi:hypothetical protein
MPNSRIRRIVSIALAAASVFWAALPGEAHHAVLRFNLEEMTAAADRVFIGRCLAVEETQDSIAQGQLPVTRYTFQVERAIKGNLSAQITFQQLGHPAHRGPGKSSAITMHGKPVTPATFLHGMDEILVGERMLLFLIPNYLGGKVTYPVGLYQGAFHISQMPSGQQLARNNINNLGLFSAPYNGTAMRSGDARTIFPERDNPLADNLQLSSASRALPGKRGALPLEPLLELVDHINTAHGAPPGQITSRGANLQ